MMTNAEISTSGDVQELIALVQAGDPHGALYLVTACGARLAGYIRMLAADLGQADQELIAQQAIERAVKRIDAFDPSRGTFDAWIRGYARNVTQEFRRRGTSMAVSPETLDVADNASNEDAVVDYEQTQRADLLAGAVQELSDTDQLIIRLRDYEELSYAEIAKMLNVQEAACRQRHTRALSRLRNVLETNTKYSTVLTSAE